MTARDPLLADGQDQPAHGPRVRLAGNPQVVLADGRTVPLERRDAAVLAYLALEGETPRARLVQMLWPDVEPELARNTLRQRLYQLKKRCGLEFVRGSEMLELAGGLGIDLRDGTASAAPLLDACDYHDYPVFRGWLDKQNERFTAARRTVLVEQAEAAERDGRLAAAIGFAERLIALEPLQEHGHRRLMRLHYLRGDRAAALVAFDRCERILKDEIGTRPGTETLALLDTIQNSAAAAPRSRVPIPASILRPPRLVGRSRELASVVQAWESGRGFLLEGEAGLGKSRLLAELAADTPGAVLAQARPGDAAIPYASLGRLLRALLERVPAARAAAPRGELARVLPELGDTPPGQQEAHSAVLQQALEAVVAAACKGGVGALLLDDLHYADAASLEMLCALGASTGAPRWGFASRSAEVGAVAHKALQDLVEARRLVTIALSPLDERQLAELIDSLGLGALDGARLAPLLLRHTGGNPMFVLETIKQMTLTGADGAALPHPDSVGQLIAARLRRLSPAATMLARTAAIAGTDFSVDLAEAVTGRGALQLVDAWQELQDAHILSGEAFAHDLVYEAALASVPAAIARRLHREIAQRLQQHGGVPARVALHYTGAGLPAQAAEHWLAAGKAAQVALRFVEAIEAFQRAADGFAAGGRPDLAFDAAYAMRSASFEVDLAERSSAALELLERFATTPVQRARAHNERAVTRLHQGDLPGTEASTLAGLRELGDADEPVLRAELRRNLAAVHVWRNETQAAVNEMRSAQPDVERFGSPQQKFEFWQSLAIILDHVDQLDEAEQLHRRAIDAAVAMGNLPGAAQSALNLATMLHDAGRLNEALAATERARAMLAAVEAGRLSYSSLHLNLGFIQRGLGDYTGALQQLSIAIENCRAQTPGWLPLAMAHRAQLFVHLGQFARAQQDLDAARPDDSSPMTARCKWVAVKAALDVHLGQRAVDELDRLIALQPPNGRRLLRWRLQRARLEHVDAQEAARSGLALLGEIDAAGRTALAISVAALTAPRLDAVGRTEDARALARQALERMQHLNPDDAYRGDIWWQCATVLRTEFDAQLPAAAAWVKETSQTRVPAEYRDSFLNRNPSNRELIRAAERQRARRT